MQVCLAQVIENKCKFNPAIGSLVRPQGRQSLLASGENGFKMRRLFLFCHDADIYTAKTCLLQPVMKIALGEPEPTIAIKLMGLFKVMLEKIQNHDLPTRLQGLMSAGHSPRWFLRVM